MGLVTSHNLPHLGGNRRHKQSNRRMRTFTRPVAVEYGLATRRWVMKYQEDSPVLQFEILLPRLTYVNHSVVGPSSSDHGGVSHCVFAQQAFPVASQRSPQHVLLPPQQQASHSCA